jgi:hypothetical protein
MLAKVDGKRILLLTPENEEDKEALRSWTYSCPFLMGVLYCEDEPREMLIGFPKKPIRELLEESAP